MKITSILFVDQVEPSLDFWVGKLGFTKTVEVPEGNKIGFAILQKGSAELMIETRSSVLKEDPAKGLNMSDYMHVSAALYIEVDDFADLLKRVDGTPVVMPVRKTFYGMDEIGLREPGGNLVTFASRSK